MQPPYSKFITKSARLLFLPATLLLSAYPVLAREDWAICGTSPTRDAEERALHTAWTRSAPLGRIRTSAITTRQPSATPDVGNIAILEDSSGIVARRNPFDLVGRTLRFTPVSAGITTYRYETADGSYNADLATQGTALPLGDDDTTEVAFPFSFPFFGHNYSSVWVNSDGNVTFGAGDASGEARTVGRVTSGEPRIAALFHDMDPTRPGANIRAFAAADQLTISWVAVPRFQSFGLNQPQTFQLRLYRSGQIEIAYDTVLAPDAIVGIAPGHLQGVTNLVKFRNPGLPEFPGAVLERFSASEALDMTFVAQRFYETHEDAYDYLAVYNNMNIDADVGAVAFALTYRAIETGTGQTPVDIAAEGGSPRRLQTLMNMGQLSQYPTDPNGPVPKRGNSGDSPLSIIGHETGHRFLAYASVIDPQTGATPMLTSDGAHWAFTFNSDASLMQGNRIQDGGATAKPRFLTTATTEGYSALDQYLMGFQPPQEVQPTFYVANATVNPSAIQQRGVAFDGTRRDVTIDEVIADQGRRTPDSTVAPRRFRMAFILVTAAGITAAAADLAKIETYRSQFESYFSRTTGGRAIMETSLRRNVDLSLWPAAGVVAGSTTPATLRLSAPAEAPLNIALQATSGNISAPATVTIPEGESSVRFDVRGLRVGVDELKAEPTDPHYGGTTARVQVLKAADLQIKNVSGADQSAIAGRQMPQPIRFQVFDVNRLPYAGVRVQAITTTGTVGPIFAFTDEGGFVEFHWTPASGILQQVTATIAGGASVTAVADTKPVIFADGIANAASFAPGMVPGSIATLFGANLASGQTAEATPPLPTRLGDVTVTVGSVPAQLYYVSDGQINFVVPPGLSPGEVDVVVTTGTVSTPPTKAKVYAVQPAIFRNAAEWAVVIHDDRLEIFATGLGPTIPLGTGPEATVGRPQVTLGGQPLELISSVLAPNSPGLYLVNVKRPAGRSGSFNLQITMDGIASNTVLVYLP